MALASGSFRTECAPNHDLSGSRVGSRFQAPVFEKNPLKSCGHKASRLVKVSGDESRGPGTHISRCPYPGPIHSASQIHSLLDPITHQLQPSPSTITHQLQPSPSTIINHHHQNRPVGRWVDGRPRYSQKPEKSSTHTQTLEKSMMPWSQLLGALRQKMPTTWFNMFPYGLQAPSLGANHRSSLFYVIEIFNP